MDEQLDTEGLEPIKPQKSETLEGKYSIRVRVAGHAIGVRVFNEEEALYRKAAKYASEYYESFAKRASSASVGECLSYALFSVAVELKQSQQELEALRKELEELNSSISQTLSGQ